MSNDAIIMTRRQFLVVGSRVICNYCSVKWCQVAICHNKHRDERWPTWHHAPRAQRDSVRRECVSCVHYCQVQVQSPAPVPNPNPKYRSQIQVPNPSPTIHSINTTNNFSQLKCQSSDGKRPSMTFLDLPWPSMTFYQLLRPLWPSMIVKPKSSPKSKS